MIAVIVCPGPSASYLDVPKLTKLGKCFAVNRAICMFSAPYLPEGMVAVDPLRLYEDIQYILDDKDIIKFYDAARKEWEAVPASVPVQTRRWNPATDPWKENLTYIYRRHREGQVIEPLARVCVSRRSTVFATMLAFEMGYQHFYYYGCDCGFDGKQPYNIDMKIDERGLNNRRATYQKAYQDLKRMHSYAAHHGVEMINLSPSSKLAEFMPTMTLDEALEQTKEQRESEEEFWNGVDEWERKNGFDELAEEGGDER